MDILLLLLVLVVIILLIVAYILNRVPRTGDYEKILHTLQLNDPTVTSYCVGQNGNGKYLNVSLDENGKTVVEEDPSPIDTHSQYIIQKPHGEITDLPNGFKMSGIVQTFNCPSGYSGPTCQLNPICTDGEENSLKPLTYQDFLSLGLYTNTFKFKQIDNLAAVQDPPHPRLRIKCLTNGEYQIEACPRNKLLDENLKCVAYDICQDSINGYKHNYAIKDGDSPLKPNEYYICSNNKSEKTSCSNPDAVFSVHSQGCIVKSECYGKGDITLPYSDNSYIQCSNDQAKIVKCDTMLPPDDINPNYRCYHSTCTEQSKYYDASPLKYLISKTVCEKDVAHNYGCDPTISDKELKFSWIDSFTYTLKNWPNEVLDPETLTCKPPTMDIISSNVKLKFSDLMPDSHEFNLKTNQYVCDKNQYTIDYLNGQIIPPSGDPYPYYQNFPDEFLPPNTPCHDSAVSNWPHHVPFRQEFSPNVKLLPGIFGIKVALSDSDYPYWPSLKNGNVVMTIISYADEDGTKGNMTNADRYNFVMKKVKRPFDETKPVKGFSTKTDSKGNFILFGAESYTPSNIIWYKFFLNENSYDPSFDEADVVAKYKFQVGGKITFPQVVGPEQDMYVLLHRSYIAADDNEWICKNAAFEIWYGAHGKGAVFLRNKKTQKYIATDDSKDDPLLKISLENDKTDPTKQVFRFTLNDTYLFIDFADIKAIDFTASIFDKTIP